METERKSENFILLELSHSILRSLNLILEKDWEDIRKMPEHSTLMKDFRKNKSVANDFSFSFSGIHGAVLSLLHMQNSKQHP